MNEQRIFNETRHHILRSAANSGERSSSAIERFLNQQNIQRYRRLLNVVSDATQRRQIINLLEEEVLTQERLSES